MSFPHLFGCYSSFSSVFILYLSSSFTKKMHIICQTHNYNISILFFCENTHIIICRSKQTSNITVILSHLF